MIENGQATINCNFSFKCPKTWGQLTSTGQENVRFCGECRREVYLIQTEDELRKHSAQGHCIAVPLVNEVAHNNEQEIGHAVGQVRTAYGLWNKTS